jgi:hypothetical protein
MSGAPKNPRGAAFTRESTANQAPFGFDHPTPDARRVSVFITQLGPRSRATARNIYLA